MAGPAGARPLEHGWLPDTPVGDTVLRRFLHNQGELNAAIATAAGGRADASEHVLVSDTGGPVPYFNQAVLRRPLDGPDDPALDEVDRFFGGAGGRPRTILSLWPTPDLTGRGWTLVGHPAFVVRGAHPHDPVSPEGVEVRAATDATTLAAVERVAIEGYPIDEAAGLPAGSVFPEALLGTGLLFRLGLVDGAPAAAGGRYVAHGVVNLCFGATLPTARRRGVWRALVWARVDDAPDLPAVAYTSDDSRPGFERMGFLPVTRFTLWARS